MPRNTRLTSDVASAILDALRDGCNVKETCARAGISRGVFYLWQRQKGEYHVAFANAVTIATAAGDVKRHRDLLISLGAIAA